MYPLTAHKAQLEKENEMFAFDKTKEYVFIKCTYMY